MVEIILLSLIAGILTGGVGIWGYRTGLKRAPQPVLELPPPEIPEIPAPVVHIDLEPVHKAVRELPNKVLQSIQNSTNTQKGAVGELIGFLRLQAQYDRVIPLGNIVDFLCIKLPSDSRSGMDGRIDFVDVKTGKNARLSKDQKALRELISELIQDDRINFVELKVKEVCETSSQRH